jgi:hypothetical protein
MTELNNFPQTDANPAGLNWPQAAAGTGTPGSLGADHGGDATVNAVLGRLADIPGLPVSGHAEAYSALHDALLNALNEAGPSPEGDA